jgi:4-amino-4-deoxy-L-arabinose transferase-like glycosyltransferase
MLPCLLIFILLRLFFWVHTFPNPDEAYYWLWGQHPDWSYYDHPPLHAWIQGAVTAILGRSLWTLRLPNLVSNGLLFYTYYRICQYLYRDRAGQTFGYVVLLILASPLYFLFLALAWHDHWLVTGGLISAYLFITFADGYIATGRGQSWRLYGAAIALGLSGLCKYNAVFIGIGFVATMIVDRRLHGLWRDRRLYMAIVLSLLILLPIFFWNISNDFQSVQYYVNRSVSTGSFGIKVSPGLNFILFSILMVSPVNFYAFIQVFWQYFQNYLQESGSRNFKDKDKDKDIVDQAEVSSVYLTVAVWTCLLSTLCLTVIAFLSAGLYYWNITAYLLLFPLIPPLFWQRTGAPTRRFRVGQGYGLLFAVLLVVHYSVFPLSALVSPDADPDSRMLWGWEQVAAAITHQAKDLGDRPRMITTDYRSASALAYQLNQKNVEVISDRIDQFDFWQSEAQVARLSTRPAILLADDWHPFDAKFRSRFDHISAVTTVPITRWGHWIKNYYLAIGYE